ncbi:MAG: ester cyclase [Planctomycetes bacterium]|nr:ester cyclase [Planctomycetota bacterium]
MTLTDLSQAREERIQFANIELLEKGNLVVIDEVFSSEYLAHVGGNKTRGTAFVQRYVKLVRDALNNVRVVKIDFLNHTDDTVTWQRTLRGTHKNAMLGIPPSGKRVEWKDMLHTRFDGDQIAEEWAVSELAGELMLKLPAKNS